MVAHQNGVLPLRLIPFSPNPNSPNPNMFGLGIGLGSGFEYFRQYNVIRRIGIRRNGGRTIKTVTLFWNKGVFCGAIAQNWDFLRY